MSYQHICDVDIAGVLDATMPHNTGSLYMLCLFLTRQLPASNTEGALHIMCACEWDSPVADQNMSSAQPHVW